MKTTRTSAVLADAKWFLEQNKALDDMPRSDERDLLEFWSKMLVLFHQEKMLEME